MVLSALPLLLIFSFLPQADEKAIKEKQAEVLAFAKTAKSEREFRAALLDLKKLGEQAYAINKFDLAVKLYGDAEKIARGSLKDVPAAQSLQEAAKRAAEVGKEFGKADKAISAILRNEATPEDYTASGKFTCFVKGDWELGLSDLSKGKDETLKKLAEDDLAAANPLALGDAWFGMMKKEPGAKERVLHWYGKAWPSLSGIDKEKVRDRLNKLYGPIAPGKPAPLPAGWSGSTGDFPKVEVLPGRAPSGGLALRITPGKTGKLIDILRAPPVQVKAGQKCEFSAWVLSDGTDGGGDKVFFWVKDAADKLLIIKEPKIDPDTPVWNHLSWSLDLPDGAARAGVGILLDSSKGFVWADDISVLIDGREALTGGGFER